MADLKLAEIVVDLAVAKLKLNMPQRIAAINAEKNDGLKLSAPADSSYISFGRNQIPTTPALIVTNGATDFQREFEGPHSFFGVTDLLVYVLEADPDRTLLGRRLLRQGRAVLESLWDADPMEALSSSAYRITPLRDRPGPVYEPETDTVDWRGLYLVVFSVTQLEG